MDLLLTKAFRHTLLETQQVHVPRLGIFSVQHHPTKLRPLSDDTFVLTPPNKHIAFWPEDQHAWQNQTFRTHLNRTRTRPSLAEYTAGLLDLNATTSEQLLTDFVGQFFHDLDEQGEVTIKDWGRFYRTNQILCFEPDPSLDDAINHLYDGLGEVTVDTTTRQGGTVYQRLEVFSLADVEPAPVEEEPLPEEPLPEPVSPPAPISLAGLAFAPPPPEPPAPDPIPPVWVPPREDVPLPPIGDTPAAPLPPVAPLESAPYPEEPAPATPEPPAKPPVDLVAAPISDVIDPIESVASETPDPVLPETPDLDADAASNEAESLEELDEITEEEVAEAPAIDTELFDISEEDLQEDIWAKNPPESPNDPLAEFAPAYTPNEEYTVLPDADEDAQPPADPKPSVAEQKPSVAEQKLRSKLSEEEGRSKMLAQNAADAFLALYRSHPDSKQAGDALFRAAEHFQQAGDTEKANSLYAEYRAKFLREARRIERRPPPETDPDGPFVRVLSPHDELEATPPDADASDPEMTTETAAPEPVLDEETPPPVEEVDAIGEMTEVLDLIEPEPETPVAVVGENAEFAPPASTTELEVHPAEAVAPAMPMDVAKYTSLRDRRERTRQRKGLGFWDTAGIVLAVVLAILAGLLIADQMGLVDLGRFSLNRSGSDPQANVTEPPPAESAVPLAVDDSIQTPIDAVLAPPESEVEPLPFDRSALFSDEAIIPSQGGHTWFVFSGRGEAGQQQAQAKMQEYRDLGLRTRVIRILDSNGFSIYRVGIGQFANRPDADLARPYLPEGLPTTIWIAEIPRP